MAGSLSEASAAERSVLVLGATGTQGGAVCRHLSACGFRVTAITRDASTAKARRIAELPGVELVECDADREGALEEVFAARSPYRGVYSVQANDYSEGASEREIAQGRRVVDLCEVYDVPHLVYSSVAELAPAELPDVATKVEIEAHLRASSVPFTVLRPAFFVENFLPGGFAAMTESTVGYPGFDPANPVPQQYIYIDDLGMIAADVLREGAPWFGRTLELAGGSLTPAEVLSVFSEHVGRPMSAPAMPVDAFGEAVAPLFVFMRDRGWQSIDIDALRARFPRLHTLADALRDSGL